MIRVNNCVQVGLKPLLRAYINTEYFIYFLVNKILKILLNNNEFISNIYNQIKIKLLVIK